MPRGTLKPSLLLVGTLGAAAVSGLPAASPALRGRGEDLQAAVEVGERFLAAWGAGDVHALREALHPDLARRVLQVAGTSEGALRQALAQVAGLPAALGPQGALGTGRRNVAVLDLRGRMASLAVELGGWSAYLHLARRGEGYGIVNVLWEWMGSERG